MDAQNGKVSRAINSLKRNYSDNIFVATFEIVEKYGLEQVVDPSEIFTREEAADPAFIRVYEMDDENRFNPIFAEPAKHPFVIIRNPGDEPDVNMFELHDNQIVVVHGNSGDE